MSAVVWASELQLYMYLDNYLMDVLHPPIDCKCHKGIASLFAILFWVLDTLCGTRQLLNKYFLKKMNKWLHEVTDSVIAILREWKLKYRHFNWGFISKIRRWHISMLQCPIIIFRKVSCFLWKKALSAVCQAAFRATCHVAGSKRKFGFWRAPIWTVLLGPLDTTKADFEILFPQLLQAL